MRAICVFSSVMMFLASTSALAAEDPGKVLGYLPDKLGADSAASNAAERFVGKRLFDYMNGGAELYLAYGFSDISVRKYKKGASEVSVEIYRMGSDVDAYGIYAHRAKGQKVDIGIPATLAGGMLSFFKGSIYVRLVVAVNPDKAKDDLVAVGKALTALLPGQTKFPAEIGLLPGGAVNGSMRYLPNSQTAKLVWFDGEGDVLLTKQSKAFFALYAAGDNDIGLTRATFEKKADAAEICLALAKKLGLKTAQKDGECSAAGQTPDEVYAIMTTQDGILRWASGGADLKSTQNWLKKIK
ncbi:MAG: hypothetical protein JRJ87_11355 [Deltaproteobacteria bacterium]|nr:hypothetical protein [Deltaproteobacteria bacterium]